MITVNRTNCYLYYRYKVINAIRIIKVIQETSFVNDKERSSLNIGSKWSPAHSNPGLMLKKGIQNKCKLPKFAVPPLYLSL